MTAKTTRRSRSLRAMLLGLSIFVVGAGIVGCGPSTSGAFVSTPVGPGGTVNIDADPAALLPFGALMVANLDARTLSGSTVGGDFATLAERVIPFSREIDFQVKRDLERVHMGMYAFSGADTIAVLTGTFHPEKIDAAAKAGVLKTSLGVVVASTYAGRTFYTVANYGFTVLTARTVLAGTETAMRRALDRIQAGTVRRELAPWMAEWALQPGYPILLASDVTRQSFGKTVTNWVPWIAGTQYVRIRGRFNGDSSLGISGALSYPDPAKATTAANGLSGIAKSFAMMGMLKLIGIDPLIRNMDARAAGNDVQFSTVIDERTTRKLTKFLADWVSAGGSPSEPPLPWPSPTPPAGAPPPTGGTSI